MAETIAHADIAEALTRCDIEADRLTREARAWADKMGRERLTPIQAAAAVPFAQLDGLAYDLSAGTGLVAEGASLWETALGAWRRVGQRASPLTLRVSGIRDKLLVVERIVRDTWRDAVRALTFHTAGGLGPSNLGGL